MIVKQPMHLSIHIDFPERQGKKIQVFRSSVIITNDIDLDRLSLEIPHLIDSIKIYPDKMTTIPFGSKWRKQAMKMKKKDLVNFLRDTCKQLAGEPVAKPKIKKP